MEVKLQSGEQIVDLERNGYKIIQNRERFCFGMDAVLLTGFAKVGKGERALDLGTGTGIIPILLEAKTEGQDFEALEIQPESAEMARRSVMLNNLQDRIKIVDGDIKEASKIFGAASFNVVTTNPPYMTENHGVKNPDEPMFTLTVTDRHGIVHKGRIRRLMPIECWRLQGFTTEQFRKVEAVGMSDAQLYKQAGNAVTTNVVEAVARIILETEKGENA